MTTRGSNVHKPIVKLLMGILKMLVLCNFLKVLMVLDIAIHKALELIKLYTQNPIREEFFFFIIYPNYTSLVKEQLARSISSYNSLTLDLSTWMDYLNNKFSYFMPYIKHLHLSSANSGMMLFLDI